MFRTPANSGNELPVVIAQGDAKVIRYPVMFTYFLFFLWQCNIHLSDDAKY